MDERKVLKAYFFGTTSAHLLIALNKTAEYLSQLPMEISIPTFALIASGLGFGYLITIVKLTNRAVERTLRSLMELRMVR